MKCEVHSIEYLNMVQRRSFSSSEFIVKYGSEVHVGLTMMVENTSK